MDVKKDKKTFDRLFVLFVRMGEEKLGRQLNAKEISQLRSVIAKKCENIDKKYIVREIYNLEKSKREKENGPLGIREKLGLRKKVSNYTKCPVKYTSSSTDLAKVVANRFTNLQVKDAFKRNPNLRLKAPEFLEQEKRKLKNSYIHDKFHYKAPKSLSKTMKRLIALGGVAAITLGIGTAVHFKNIQIPEKDEITTESILEENSIQPLTPRDYLLDSIGSELPYLENYNPTLENFKDVFANELNSMDNSSLSSGVIIMKSRPHTFIYELTDSSGNKFYITKGNSPGTTEELLQKAGYSCTRIDDYNSNVDVISVIANNNFIAACASIDGKIVPICADGTQFSNHAPSQQELNSRYSNIINKTSVADSQLLADLYSTGAFDKACAGERGDYVDCLLEYIEEHPDSYLAKEVNLAIEKSQNTQTQTTTADIQQKDNEIEY